MSRATVFAFFGEDLGPDPSKVLGAIYSQGHALVALDSDAVAHCHAGNLPFSTIDDWLDAPRMIAAKKRAAGWEDQWYRSVPGALTADDICWPEIDREAMYWFWLSASVAMELAEALVSRHVEELAVPERGMWRPSVYYSPSDVHLACWRQTLAGRVRFREVSSGSASGADDLAGRRAVRRVISFVTRESRQAI